MEGDRGVMAAIAEEIQGELTKLRRVVRKEPILRDYRVGFLWCEPGAEDQVLLSRSLGCVG